MRAIKFRAWDKGRKRWVQPEATLTLSGSFMPVQPENYVLMQYTGFKDKNGKEIYEGDIGVFINEYQQTERFVVEFNRYSLEKVDMMNYYGGKVIGNIYENPELLEKGHPHL